MAQSESEKLLEGLPPEIREEASRLQSLQNDLMNEIRFRAVTMIQAVEAIQQVNFPRASVLLLSCGAETEAKKVHKFADDHLEDIVSMDEKVGQLLKQSPEEFENKVAKARMADVDAALGKFK